MIEIITILALLLSSIYIAGIILNFCNIYEFKLHLTAYGIYISWKYYVFFGNRFHKFDRYKELVKFNKEPFNPF